MVQAALNNVYGPTQSPLVMNMVVSWRPATGRPGLGTLYEIVRFVARSFLSLRTAAVTLILPVYCRRQVCRLSRRTASCIGYPWPLLSKSSLVPLVRTRLTMNDEMPLSIGTVASTGKNYSQTSAQL